MRKTVFHRRKSDFKTNVSIRLRAQNLFLILNVLHQTRKYFEYIHCSEMIGTDEALLVDMN